MITSKENSLIKHVKSLNSKKYRDEFGEYIIEGLKMSLEAFKYCDISSIIICKELLDEYDEVLTKIDKAKLTSKLQEVSKNVFVSISDTKTPQGILVVSKIPNASKRIKEDTIFALDDIQDPGNLGTIIRTLDSAGYKNLIISSETADPFNSKVVRSTMGAIFRLNIIRVKSELSTYLESLKKDGYKIVTTSLDAKSYIYDLDFDEKLIIVIGNESKGVSQIIQKMSDIKVKIPMIRKNRKLKCCCCN